MVFGVAAVSVIAALVTSAYVAYERLGGGVKRHAELVETLARIEQRLDALER